MHLKSLVYPDKILFFKLHWKSNISAVAFNSMLNEFQFVIIFLYGKFSRYLLTAGAFLGARAPLELAHVKKKK